MLVSAVLSGKGAPWEALRRWMADGFDLVVAPRLLYELQAVLAREKFRRYLTYEEAVEYVSWLHHEAEVLEELDVSFAVGATTDPDDDYLVGLTILAGASYLVSGDSHLLGLPDRAIKDEEGRVLARVVTPREFLREAARRE